MRNLSSVALVLFSTAILVGCGDSGGSPSDGGSGGRDGGVTTGGRGGQAGNATGGAGGRTGGAAGGSTGGAAGGSTGGAAGGSTGGAAGGSTGGAAGGSTGTAMVTIVAPTGDVAPFADVSRRLLAASSTQVLRDQDAAMAGAQTAVVACATVAGAARLLAGPQAGTLVAVGSVMNTGTAGPGDNCPAGFGFSVRFANVTLPESVESATGALTTATELRVDLTPPSGTVQPSTPVRLWVDSIAPTLTANLPNPLCGGSQSAPGVLSTTVTLTSSTAAVMLSVTNMAGMTTMSAPSGYTGGVATFSPVSLSQGTNTLVVIATETAGNSTRLAPPAGMPTCTVTVSAAPTLFFSTPAGGFNLCATGNTAPTCIADANATTAGWQGNVTVHVSGTAGPVTTGNVSLVIAGGAAMALPLNTSGNATATDVTVPNGDAVILTATGPGGMGMASITIRVDTIAPNAVAQLVATVTDRRKTTMRLTWAAPSDNGMAIAGYDVRQSVNVLSMGASFDGATAVTYPGTPLQPGIAELVDVTDLYVQKPYYFAIRPRDAVGNLGPVTVTAAATMSSFNQTILAPPAGGPAMEAFGYSMDSADDVSLSTTPATRVTHLLVGNDGTRRQVYLYSGAQFSAASPATAPAPLTTFIGTTDWFGLDVSFAGDLDGDGRSEIAIAAPKDGTGKVFIFKGRDTWPATLAESAADYTIVGAAPYAAGGAGMGYALARAGDFNGDGRNDFAIGTWTYGAMGVGRVDLVLGGSLPAAPATINLSGDAPAAPPAQVITIDGDSAFVGGSFGDTVTSLVNGTDMALVVGASYAGAGSRGRTYSFRRRTLAGGSRLTFAGADASIEGATAGAQLGETIGTPGISGTGIPGVVVASPYATLATPASKGFVQLYQGTPANPFSGTPLVIGNSQSTTSTDLFGLVVIGGGFSGQSRTMSILKNTTPDLLIAGTKQNGGTATLYIIDGATIGGIASPADMNTIAAVKVPLPAGWVAAAARSRAIPDLDGDGYQDFAIGENVGTAGRVVVFW